MTHSITPTRRAVFAAAATLTAIPAWAASTDGDRAIRRMLAMRIDVQKGGTGAIVALTTPKGRRIISHGVLGKRDRRPVTGRTLFDVGSITKVFIALALADMARRGEVALDDPVAKYLPAGVTPPSRNGRRITLADLATHTAGFPLRPGNLVSKDPENKYAGYNEALLDQFVSSYALPRDPGAGYEYSNVGFALLGQALAHRAGMTEAALIRNRVTEPLGLIDTRYDLAPGAARRMAHGYGSDLKPAPRWEMDGLPGAGGLISTADDLLILLEAFLGRRRAALAPAMKAMLAVRRPGGMQPATGIALAWNIQTEGDVEFFWKNGSVGGFRSFAGFNPASGVGVVALCNAGTALGVDDIGMSLLGSKLPVDMHIPRVHRQVPMDPRLYDRFVGRYRYSETDVVKVVRDGDRLFVVIEPGTDRLELFPESDHAFFIKEVDCVVDFRFEGPGPASEAIWNQNGASQTGRRIP